MSGSCKQCQNISVVLVRDIHEVMGSNLSVLELNVNQLDYLNAKVRAEAIYSNTKCYL